MNEHLKTSDIGVQLITHFEGEPRLEARLCEGGRYELGWGCTFHPDGRAVQKGETCETSYAFDLFQNALTVFEGVIHRQVTAPLEQWQFDALVALVYNIGEANFATGPNGPCTVLRETNAHRIYDAAAAFGMWVFATKDGYRQALRGLLRRHYAEACVFLGYDWREATADDAIALQREKPKSLPGADKVLYKTPFSDVLRVAQRYALSKKTDGMLLDVRLDLPAAPDLTAVAPPKPFDIDTYEREAGELLSNPDQPALSPVAADSKGVEAAVRIPVERTVELDEAPSSTGKEATPGPNASQPPAVLPPTNSAPVGTKPPSLNTLPVEHVPYRVDPNAGLKPMEETERFVGAAFMFFGTIARVLMGNGVKVSGVGGVVVVAILDMMKSPTNLAVLISVAAIGITGFLWFVGFCMDKFGLHKKKKGEAAATQAMY